MNIEQLKSEIPDGWLIESVGETYVLQPPKPLTLTEDRFEQFLSEMKPLMPGVKIGLTVTEGDISHVRRVCKRLGLYVVQSVENPNAYKILDAEQFFNSPEMQWLLSEDEPDE